MKKKYTTEEFKEMFKEAETKAVEEFDERIRGIQKERGQKENMTGFMMGLQNMIIISMLERHLFEKEK